jgi:hypothetical protein
MSIRQLTLLVVLLSTTPAVSRGQANSAQPAQPNNILTVPYCKHNVQAGMQVCTAVLHTSIDTKKSKAGDHVFVEVALLTAPAGPLITRLDAAIIGVQPAKTGRSVLRIRIDRAVSKDGREVPVQVNVLALASQSSVMERWDYPIIIADRFPPEPEDEVRLPGETKASEYPRHSTPLDAMPDLPVHHTMVCNKKAKGVSGSPCVDLLDARGIYGHKGVMLEAGDTASPADSVLSSKKNIRLPAGTLMVLRVKDIHGSR